MNRIEKNRRQGERHFRYLHKCVDIKNWERGTQQHKQKYENVMGGKADMLYWTGKWRL